MRNLELKARFPDLGRAEEIARSIGATPGGDLAQRDTYFRFAGGRLKLREDGRGGGELIFYRRPEDSPARWSDYFKAPVSAPEELRDVLARALGVSRVVEKTRRLLWYRGARIHLDRVEGLGTFVEFEVPAGDGAAAGDETDPVGGTAAAARAVMDELMRAFGLTGADSIAASYGEMAAAE